MGSSLTYLNLGSNAITSLPTEIGALTGLEVLDLVSSALTSVPRLELEGGRSNSRDGLGGDVIRCARAWSGPGGCAGPLDPRGRAKRK